MKIATHPNGFLQIWEKDGNKRLHIWSDEIPRQAVRTAFHNHAFGFKSKVLMGNIINTRVRVEWVPPDRLEETKNERRYRWYKVEPDPESRETTLRKTSDALYMLSLLVSDLVKVGESYSMEPGEFHESQALGFTVTEIEKTSYDYDTEVAVLVPEGAEPDNSFERQEIDILT